MPWYKCFIHGKHFPGELAGVDRSVGFYTCRFVQAQDPENAERKALAGLRTEPKLALPAGVVLQATATVHFEKIVEVPATEVPEQAQGFVWYREDADNYEE